MQFSKVIGQEEVKRRLVHMVAENRLSHALLFLGPEGTGGLQLALAFAQYVTCEKVNQQNNGGSEQQLFGESQEQGIRMDSCGICNSCKKAIDLVHPDIHYSYPVVTKKAGEKPISTDYIKEWRQFVQQQPYGNNYDWLQFIGAENKQGNITASECEDILRKISLKSFESQYKILILWMPELLGNEGNKLLKLLEEPPSDTLFILVAENQSLILPTIISRTQLVRIPRLSQTDIESALVKKDIPLEKSQKIAAISNGNYHEAESLLQHVEDDWEGVLRDWLNSIVKTGPQSQVKWIDEISKSGREKQKQFLKFFTHLLQHTIRIQALGLESASRIESQSTTDFAIRLNKLCNLEQHEAIIRELDKASYHIERNANAKLLFHALTIRLYHIISNKTVILVN